MEAMENNFTAVNDLKAACRICLQIKEDMVDIFGSGMDSQIMEVTKLKLRSDDRLPKTICQNCSLQMNNLYKFIEQAKSSDTYLRTLLISQESVKEQLGNKLVEKNCLKKSEIRKRHCKYSKVNKKLNNNFESEKMYLIIVPEGNDKEHKDLEISIKDLSSSNVNLEIFHYCKSLIKSQISDHTYPKEQKDYSDIRPLKNDLKNFIPNEYFSESEIEENKVYFVNFKVLKCEECKTDFEEITDLNDHISTHKDSPSVSINNYECPVCNYNENIKVEFMAHLHSHTLKGLSFVTINADGEEISLQDSINVKSNLKSFEDCKVFNLNFSSVKCSVCFQNIQSEELIPDHIKLCLSREFPELEFFIKYTCPVCYKPFFNDKENFIGHLSSHQNENIYFINVTDTGHVVKSENYEKFVPYEKAFEAIKIYNEGKIFKIVEINSCENCDYVSESFDSLCKHYRDSHSQEISKDVSLICQLCLEEWKTGDIDEKRAKFYEHLRTHQNKGVTFIRVNKNGSFFTFSDSYSEIFNQSIVLYSLINNPLTANQIWTPELITNQKNNIDFQTYTCDLCQKQFMKKREVIKHLKLHQTGDFNYKNSNYICEKCGKKCTNKITYRKHFSKHLRTQGQIKRYPICSVCNKTFSNRSTLNGHMRQHFKEGVGNELGNFFQGIICEKCGKEFSNNASLTKHKKLHLGDKENSIYKCEICDRDFFRQSAFERHKSAHLNPKYFECNVCKLPLSTVTSLQKHSEMHQNGSNTFDCKTCRVSFLTKDSLTAHQTRKGHNLDRKPLECNVCHEKFFIGKRFMEHIKTHPKYKMEECNLCGKRLSTIQSLMLHMDRHFESNCILCPHCGKQFFEEKNYRRHLMTHDGIRPFLCDVDNCKKSFYTLFELNRHKKYHNNTRDFRCSYCSKSFHEANHLTVHIRIHTGERPYICPHCNKGFVTRTRCKQHIKLVHQGVGYELIRSSISKKVTVFTNKETVV